jgi:hypothetical protein
MEIRGGFSAIVLNGRGLLSAEMDQADGPGMRLRGGTEYWVQPMIGLRVGMDDQEPAGGMSYRFAGKYQFDYGVQDHPARPRAPGRSHVQVRRLLREREGGARGVLPDRREGDHRRST